MAETVRCSSCGAPNRAPLEKIKTGQARCGKCRAGLSLPARKETNCD